MNDTSLSKLREEILSVIPSESLKRHLKAADYCPSDQDLLNIAFHYAPDYDTRLRLLQGLEQTTSGAVREYTARVLEMQRRILADFCRPADDAVFELHIKDTPDAWDERYLCRTYESAVGCIALFYKEYEGVSGETEASCYRIVKRRIRSEGEPFAEDALGEMILLPGQKLYSVDLYDEAHDFREGDGVAIDPWETLFPNDIGHGDAVKCMEPATGKTFYGVAYRFDEAQIDSCYVLPLTDRTLNEADLEHLHDAHDHVLMPLVEQIDASALPEKLKENYQLYLQCIQK
jgi:hypothetical protein